MKPSILFSPTRRPIWITSTQSRRSSPLLFIPRPPISASTKHEYSTARMPKRKASAATSSPSSTPPSSPPPRKRTAKASPVAAAASAMAKPDPSPASSFSPAEADTTEWPAPAAHIAEARRIIRECAAAQKPTVIAPDKDADGLSSGAILRSTLIHLGLKPDLIRIHHLQKGDHVASDASRATLSSYAPTPAYLFILDQGTRPGPALLPSPPTTTLLIDHHHYHSYPADFPQDTAVVNAAHCPPVATSSLLTYFICAPLHPSVPASCAWLAVLGTHGDLGTSFQWENLPYPDDEDRSHGDMKALVFSKPGFSRSAINTAVGLVNAPRRASKCNVSDAWEALVAATTPGDIQKSAALQAAREEVAAETARWSRAPPAFSKDGKCAVVRVRSPCQVHPVVATRWAGTLKSSKLELVLCANDGFVEGKVNFSIRQAKCAKARGVATDIIAWLEGLVRDNPDASLRDRLGESFARGHKEASGGVVEKAVFEELMQLLEVGVKPEKAGGGGAVGGSPIKKKTKVAAQGNTLRNYFGKGT